MPLVTGGATVCGDGVMAEVGNVVFYQLVPWHFDTSPEHFNQRRTFEHSSYAVSRLLGNFGVERVTPLLQRFSQPAGVSNAMSLVRNGDFSVATNNQSVAEQWEFSASAPGAACMREALAGPQSGWSQIISVPPVAAGKRPEAMLAQHDLSVHGAQWYRLSLRARAEGLTGKEVNWTVQNTANWQALFDYQRFVPKPDWQAFSFILKAKDTALKGTKFQIWFNGSGKLWLADVRLEPVPDPTVGRWNDGLYLLQPTEWDDPYRFFGW